MTLPSGSLSTSADSVAAHICVLEGRGSSDADIIKQSQQNIIIPLSVSEARHMLWNFAGIFKICTGGTNAAGDTSILHEELMSWVSHINHHEQDYK